MCIVAAHSGDFRTMFEIQKLVCVLAKNAKILAISIKDRIRSIDGPETTSDYLGNIR